MDEKTRRILVYDHDHVGSSTSVFAPQAKDAAERLSGVEFEQVLLEVAVADDGQAAQELLERIPEVAICHMYQTPWETLVDGCRPGTVCIRVASDGLRTRSNTSSRGVHCLYIKKRNEEITADDWERILRVVLDPSQLVAYSATFAPSALRDLLNVSTTDNGAALAILCQGYLAVWSVGNEAARDLDGPVRAALLAMRWDEVAEGVQLDDAAKRMAEVRQPEWWDVFGLGIARPTEQQEEKWARFIRELGEELGLSAERRSGGLDGFHPDIKHLLHQIGDGVEIDDAAVVAAAYNSLVRDLAA